MARPLTTARISLAFALAAGLLLTVAGLSYWQTDRLVESDQWVAHSRVVLDALRAALAAATTAESEARGYAIAGEGRHLERYRAAAAELPQRLATLAELTKDNPQQQQAILSLHKLVVVRLAHLQAMIDTSERQGMEAAQLVEADDSSDDAMVQLRQQLANMRQTERELLAERAVRAAASFRMKRTTEIATATLGLFVIGLAFYLYRGGVSAQRREAGRLEWQARKEAALAELRERALTESDLTAFLDHAVTLLAGALRVEFAKVLELLPDGKAFLLKAGVGWKPGNVGEQIVSADLDSQAGFTLLSSEPVVRGDLATHKPVIVDDLRTEQRFHGPQLLRDHGVISGMSVIIYDQPERPYGVLGVHTARHRRFTEDEAASLQAMANVVAAYVQRRRAEAALVQSEQRFRQLADAIPQMAWVARPDGSVEYYNRRWYEYTRLSEEQSYAPGGWQAALHPEDTKRCAQLWQQAVESGEPFDVECRYHDGDTHGYRWQLARALPVWSESGAIDRWFGTVTDIDDQKRVQLTLLEADRRKNEFLATLAHELRNPITPIANAAEMLKAAASDDPRVAEARQIIGDQIQQVRRLVDDLLEVERISRGKIQLHKERIQLETLVDRALEVARPLIEQHGQKLSIDVPGRPIWLDVDPARIVQVLVNLLHNAAKFTPEGGRIDLSAETEHQQVILRVRDTGSGIPPEMLSRIFDLFMQLGGDSEESQGGLGIGLKLVRDLVELHGGSVRANSAGAGKGSEFVVTLPASVKEVKRRIDATGAASRRRPHGHRVLLVDDHKNIVDSLALLVRDKGHQARCAYDALDALKTARSFRPDIVVTDIGLPGMDGYELAARLRSEPATRGVLLVALTGFSHEEVVRRIQEAGFDRFLVKPLNISELDAILGAAAQAECLSETVS